MDGRTTRALRARAHAMAPTVGDEELAVTLLEEGHTPIDVLNAIGGDRDPVGFDNAQYAVTTVAARANPYFRAERLPRPAGPAPAPRPGDWRDFQDYDAYRCLRWEMDDRRIDPRLPPEARTQREAFVHALGRQAEDPLGHPPDSLVTASARLLDELAPEERARLIRAGVPDLVERAERLVAVVHDLEHGERDPRLRARRGTGRDVSPEVGGR